MTENKVILLLAVVLFFIARPGYTFTDPAQLKVIG